MLRVKFTKESYLKYISHLDLMRLFNRAFRRANIPIKYSEGFNPQPRFSIAHPLSLGIESIGEYMDIELEDKIPVEVFIENMNQVLPKGIRIIKGKYVDDKASLSSQVEWSHYKVSLVAKGWKEKKVEESISIWLEKEEIKITRIRKRRGREVKREQNIRPLIGSIIVNEQVSTYNGELIGLNCLLKTGDRGNLNVIDFLQAMDRDINLNIDWDTVDILRTEILFNRKGIIQSPM